MTHSTSRQLLTLQRRYRALAAQLADVGYIAAGSITHRRTRCGNPNCRCRADPPQMHGPYWQWTAKVDGKTLTRRLSQTEAELYQGWIDNDRQLRAITAHMREVASEATELILKQAKSPPTKVNRKLRTCWEMVIGPVSAARGVDRGPVPVVGSSVRSWTT